MIHRRAEKSDVLFLRGLPAGFRATRHSSPTRGQLEYTRCANSREKIIVSGRFNSAIRSNRVHPYEKSTNETEKPAVPLNCEREEKREARESREHPTNTE